MSLRGGGVRVYMCIVVSPYVRRFSVYLRLYMYYIFWPLALW